MWNQILADICNLSVKRSQLEEATALGAAVLASVGGGVYGNVAEAAEQMVSLGKQYSPSLENQILYDALFSIHTDVYEVLEKAKVYARLATVDQ